MMASVPEVPSIGSALHGTANQEVVGTGPKLSDNAKSSLQDLVVHDTGVGVPRSVTLGDAAPAPRSS
jgi:hypothetical protein